MKNVNQNKRRPPQAALALIERTLSLWSLPKRHPIKRLKSYPLYEPDPSRQFVPFHPISNNVHLAAGRTWVGKFIDGIDHHLAYWDSENDTLVAGPYIDGSDPVFIVDSLNHDGSMWVVDEDGCVLPWNGSASTIAAPTDRDDWFKRTTTPDPASSPGGIAPYGWTNLLSLVEEQDLIKWSGLPATGYPTPRVPGDGTDTLDPAFGPYWGGKLVLIWWYGGRWWGLARGYVFDNGSEAWDGVSEFPQFAAYAVWKCDVGATPDVATNWHILHKILMNYPVDGLAGNFAGVSQGWSSPHNWLHVRGDTPFFFANPELPSRDGWSNNYLIYTMDGGEVVGSLQYPTTDCYGGVVLTWGADLYAVISNHNAQTVELWHLDEHPNVWSLFSETDWTGDPQLATAIGYNGYIHVALGKDQYSEFGTPTSGSADNTGWDILSYNIAANTWTTAARTFPPVDPSSDTGVYPRFLITHLGPGAGSGGGQGGGGGGGANPTPGNGPCDNEFQVFSDPTISLSVFEDVMQANNSPLLDEHPASVWFALLDDVGINAAFGLAIWVKESVIGAAPGQVLASSHNVANIRYPLPDGRPLQDGYIDTVCCKRFGTYPDWYTGALDFTEVCQLSIYDGLSISEFIGKYAPASENQTSEYISQACGRLNLWKTQSGL